MANFGDDRYELAGMVAQTPWSTVFRARDLESGETVALKILHGFTPESANEVIERYRSADLLSKIRHPSVARHITFDRWNDTYYIVEEFCQGYPLVKALPSATWSVSLTLELIWQVAEALEYCHGRGLLHLGVKPSNIMILAPSDGQLPQNPENLKVKLLGVGQSPLLDALDGREDPLESLVYMSPEQVGVKNQLPDPRSDIYSLGAIFYQALTGKLPHEAKDIRSFKTRLATESPIPPHNHRPEIPKALEALVLQAIAGNPDERFRSMAEFNRELLSVRRTLPEVSRKPDGEDLQLLVTLEHRLPLTERDRELKRLCTRFDRAALGRGRFIHVTGESGSGKTRLMEELRTHVLMKQGLFLWCQATEFERNRPFSPFRDGIHQFMQHILGLPEKTRLIVRKRIRSAVGNFGRELLNSIPEIKELLPGTPKMVSLEPERERQRSSKTLLNLFSAIAGPGLPVVLFIDDYQWADKGSRDLVEKLKERLPKTHLLLVCAEDLGYYDPEWADEIPGADQDDAVEALHLHLNPLGLAGCRRLFEAGLGQKGSLVTDLATVAFERCGGNLRVLVEIIKTLSREIGELDADDAAGTGMHRLQTLIPEARVEDIIGRRWHQLSDCARQIMGVASVIGRKFSPALVEMVSPASQPEILRAIGEGLENQILASWTLLGEDWHCFADEKIHEVVYASIPSAGRQRLHREVAKVLEEKTESEDSAIYEIALHYLRGGEPETSYRVVLKAALAAKKAYANREAMYFFSEALEIVPRQETRLRLEALEDLGDVCGLDGQYERAEENYQRVLQTVEDPIRKARLEGKIGDLYFRRGMNEVAIDHLTRGLSWLGRRSPRTRAGLWWSILYNIGCQVLHTMLPRRIRTLHNRRVKDIGREAVKIFHSLAYAYYFLDLPSTLGVHLRQLNLCERLGDSPELAHTYSSHGIVCSLIPLHRRAHHYQLAGLEIRKRLRDPWGIGQSYAFLGVCSLYRADLSLANEYLRKSIQLLEGTGDQWEIEAAYYHLGICHILLGNIDTAEGFSRALLKLSQEIRDLKFIAIAQICLAECGLVRGNLDRALNHTEKALETTVDNLTRVMALRVHGEILLRLNRRNEALQVLEEGISLIRKHRLRNEYVVANHISYAQALLSDTDTILSMDNRGRLRYLTRARQHVRTGLRLARKFRNHLGHALRIEALYHRLSGSSARAQRCFAQSETVLTEQGRIYELGLTLLARAQWRSRAGEMRNPEEVENLLEIFRKVGARLDLEETRELLGYSSTRQQHKKKLRSQHQQLSTLFKVSRLISSILELDILVTQVTDLAVEVIGGQKGFLFLRGAKGKPELRCGRGLDRKDSSLRLSKEQHALIHRAWQSGITQVVAREEFASTEEAASPPEGTFICVPLRIKEDTFGLIYLESDLSAELYTEDDFEFMSIFAAQAATSLQNAFSYQKVEELNLSLERKVRERTRELLMNKQELEKANRLKSEFLANMSHELRTPLNAVIAMSEILLEESFGGLNEKQQVYLRHILDSGIHLLSLINDVLDVSKVEAGRLELDSDLFDLNELLRKSLVVVRERAAKHDIALVFEPNTSEALVRGDALRIKQVALNLLTNAVKFTPEGGRVCVSTFDDEGSVVVCVEDTGIGIAPENRGIIFEEFRQVDGSKSRRFEGTGLGLALCKKFIELHEGKIWLESEEGKGSKFYFSLPLQADRRARETVPAKRREE